LFQGTVAVCVRSVKGMNRLLPSYKLVHHNRTAPLSTRHKKYVCCLSFTLLIEISSDRTQLY